MSKFDEIVNKINAGADAVKNIADGAGTAAATAGNVVGNFQAGKAAANARPINDIEVTAEIGDGVKFVAVAIVAAFLLIFLKMKK